MINEDDRLLRHFPGRESDYKFKSKWVEIVASIIIWLSVFGFFIKIIFF